MTEDQILQWADAHHRKTGEWPKKNSGEVLSAPDEKWLAINSALIKGGRGLSGGSSLPRLLAEKRDVRNIQALPALTIKQILKWADAHHQKTAKWPKVNSGDVLGAPSEKWGAIELSLVQGHRSLPGGSSLAKLLAEKRSVKNKGDLPSLTIRQILKWADAHHQKSNEWPNANSGEVLGAPDEKWRNINNALFIGLRGLPGGSSLTQLLAEKRGVRNPKALPKLSIRQILRWADLHHQKTGQWPKATSAAVLDAPSETWANIDRALFIGLRGLPGGCSLAKLLAEKRGVRNIQALPQLTINQILKWADLHFRKTGTWPKQKSGDVLGAPGEKWGAIDLALGQGHRSLPGGSTLAKLLAEKRGVRNIHSLQQLTINQILNWADAQYIKTGRWPKAESAAVLDAPGETWATIDGSLAKGRRGMPGGSSLAQLLAEKRGVRNIQALPQFTINQILKWADAYHRKTGQWPNANSGDVLGAPGEKWGNISSALFKGGRSLPGGSSLAKLLAEKRGVRNEQELPDFTIKQILNWVDVHHQKTGEWPKRDSGDVLGAPGEKWRNMDNALRLGFRGLPGGSSLAKLLAEKRGVRNIQALPQFTINQILKWADAYHRKTGQWPNDNSGDVLSAPGEKWGTISNSLYEGLRGLPGGSSLAKLLAEKRRVRD